MPHRKGGFQTRLSGWCHRLFDDRPCDPSPMNADVQNKTVTVIGAARSGLAVARLLAGRGATMFLTERGEIGDDARAALDAAGVAYEAGGHSERALDADFVAISPGVPTATDL